MKVLLNPKISLVSIFVILSLLFLFEHYSLFLVENGMAIFWQIRMPRFFGAIAVGTLLSLSGLLMQSFFRNPLASPSLLGVNAAATSSVAFWFICNLSYPMTLISFFGSALYSFLLLFLSNLFRDKLILLLFGLLFSQLAASLTTLTSSFLSAEKLKFFYFWGLGNLGRITLEESLILFMIAMFVFFLIYFLGKKIDLLWMGEEYALAHGMDIRMIKALVVVVTALASAFVTSYVGPIAFVGIIAPNVAKYFLKRSDHRILAIYSTFFGSAVMVFAEFIVSLSSNMFPLNSILGLLALPVMAYFFYLQWGKRHVSF